MLKLVIDYVIGRLVKVIEKKAGTEHAFVARLGLESIHTAASAYRDGNLTRQERAKIKESILAWVDKLPTVD